MQDLNDEQIVKQVQKGEIDAFGILIARFDKKLLRYISRFVFDINEAEDILQNVFIKTYSNLNGFNFQYKFSSWIYRIAHNEVVNYIRKASKRKVAIID
jgi:RNA polymerase sigma-70 factor (ECF subfamily)